MKGHTIAVTQVYIYLCGNTHIYMKDCNTRIIYHRGRSPYFLGNNMNLKVRRSKNSCVACDIMEKWK